MQLIVGSARSSVAGSPTRIMSVHGEKFVEVAVKSAATYAVWTDIMPIEKSMRDGRFDGSCCWGRCRTGFCVRYLVARRISLSATLVGYRRSALCPRRNVKGAMSKNVSALAGMPWSNNNLYDLAFHGQ